MNDNSVGSEISGSTGAPSRGPANCLEFGSSGTNSFVFSHLRFSYANFGLQVAMTSISSNPIEIWDCQFINCWTAVYDFAAYSGSNPGFPVNVCNVLFSQCVNGLYGTDIESVDGVKPSTSTGSNHICARICTCHHAFFAAGLTDATSNPH